MATNVTWVQCISEEQVQLCIARAFYKQCWRTTALHVGLKHEYFTTYWLKYLVFDDFAACHIDSIYHLPRQGKSFPVCWTVMRAGLLNRWRNSLFAENVTLWNILQWAFMQVNALLNVFLSTSSKLSTLSLSSFTYEITSEMGARVRNSTQIRF